QVVPRSVEEEPNDTVDMANAMTPPAERDAQLSSLMDVDIYKVTVGPGDVGKRLHVTTLPGDFDTDDTVEVLLPDGMTSFTDGPVDNTYLEDVLTQPLPSAGDYYVKIGMSSFVFTYDPASSHYE